MSQVMKYCQPDGTCTGHSHPDCQVSEDLCSDKPCGAVCNAIDDMSQVMKYCQPDGTCTGHSHPECQVSQDLCSDKSCGAVCNSADDIDHVMRFCQPDGTCSVNAQPECEDLCAGKLCGAVCDTSDGMSDVMRYCQPDGTCTSNAQPQCQDSIETKNTIICLICEAVMNALDETLVDTTNEQAVADYLNSICNYLGDMGALETMCIEFITEYTDDIIEMIVGQFLEPEKVCTAIMACP